MYFFFTTAPQKDQGFSTGIHYNGKVKPENEGTAILSSCDKQYMFLFRISCRESVFVVLLP